MRKRPPKLKNDRDVEEFLEKDLSSFLTSDNLTAMTFEFEPKEKVVNLRVSAGLLDEIKKAAPKRKMPYQKYNRQTLEVAVKK
jgi:predicted DNA binding CopG/RHH family protein